MDRPTSTTTTTATFVLDANPLIAAFTSFLQFDVASGGASGETIRTYWGKDEIRAKVITSVNFCKVGRN